MDIDKYELPTTEADVVFVGVNVEYQRVHVAPYWECDIPRKELPRVAANCGLIWAEMDGGGEVHVQIHDRRENIVA